MGSRPSQYWRIADLANGPPGSRPSFLARLSGRGPCPRTPTAFDHRARVCPTGNPRMDTMRNLPVALTCRRQPSLPCRANHPHLFGHPAASARGAFRDRHERWLWDAMDAALAIDDRLRSRTEKSRGPGAPTLALNSQSAQARFGDDGGKKARSPGRARRTPLRPSRREGRLFGSYLW
jgi:hypothetical protein